VDAAAALADLTEISSQLDAAVVFTHDGAVVASTFGDETRTERLRRAGNGLLEAAETLPSSTGRTLTRLEAALPGGSVFVTRSEGVAIVATTTPSPASTLVFHDLEACLRAVAEAQVAEEPAAERPKRPRAPRKKKTPDA
jgi:predicted regulator of Ras-like GTPase activity (Roadblock/LC7/MglB family)